MRFSRRWRHGIQLATDALWEKAEKLFPVEFKKPRRVIGKNTEDNLLNAIEMEVTRNAFGRQEESFEKKINIEGLINPYNAIFIRAPVIEKVWGSCKILAKIENKMVMVRQENILALSFHPELTNDLRIHKYFLDMIQIYKSKDL